MKLSSILSSGASARRIEAEVREAFGTEAGQIDEVLKTGPEADVFAGRFRDRAAVFKRLLTDDAAQKLVETEAELEFLTQAFGQGPVRIVRLLGTLPETKTLILERAPGERVSLALKDGDRAARSHAMAMCGNWLAAVASLRSETRPFWSRKIAERLRRDAADIPTDVTPLFQATMERMETLGLRHRRAPLTHAVAHGDFAPVNLNIDDNAIWGFDIQGGHTLPLARMAARFLVAADLYWPGATGPLGLDTEDLAAFDITRILPADEQGDIFTFFVAEQMLRRIMSETRTGQAATVARTRLQALHDQLPPKESTL